VVALGKEDFFEAGTDGADGGSGGLHTATSSAAATAVAAATATAATVAGSAAATAEASAANAAGTATAATKVGAVGAMAGVPSQRRLSRSSSSSQMPPRRLSASFGGRRLSPERSIRFINMMSINEPRLCMQGETLFRQGDEGNHMFIIKSGRVQVTVEGKDGRKHIVGERGRGECCGETACLSSNPRNCTVTCVSSDGCEVLCVSRDDFLELVRGSWDVRHDLIAVSERNSKEKQRRLNFLRTRDEVGGDYDD